MTDGRLKRSSLSSDAFPSFNRLNYFFALLSLTTSLRVLQMHFVALVAIFPSLNSWSKKARIFNFSLFMFAHSLSCEQRNVLNGWRIAIQINYKDQTFHWNQFHAFYLVTTARNSICHSIVIINLKKTYSDT